MDESVRSLLVDVPKEKKYCVTSLLHARYLLSQLFPADTAKFKATVAQTYPLVAYFAPEKVQVEQVFEPTKGE